MADALTTGSLVTLTPEKAVAGGRMLARVDGRVILVAGGIPGEPVRARIERVERSMAWATVEAVLEPHVSRRPVQGDPRCGGAVYAHIEYPEQLRHKADVIQDGLKRLARLEPPEPVAVTPSPEHGYRMRARLHVRNGRIGFFLEGTHRICPAAESGQLLPDTCRVLDDVGERLQASELNGDADLELSENVAADMRAVHVELAPGARFGMPEELGPVPGLTGFSWSHPAERCDVLVSGSPFVTDRIAAVALRRHVRAFFQGNRFLIEPLVAHVAAACPAGPVLDLYAGVGLFGVCLAATGRHAVTAVESHPASAKDLAQNAEPYASAVTVCEMPVEQFVSRPRIEPGTTLVLDPPRSGMSREAAEGAVALRAPRVVFISCDVATFARDLARFVAAGYRLTALRGFDLFPATAHVETVAVLER